MIAGSGQAITFGEPFARAIPSEVEGPRDFTIDVRHGIPARGVAADTAAATGEESRATIDRLHDGALRLASDDLIWRSARDGLVFCHRFPLTRDSRQLGSETRELAV